MLQTCANPACTAKFLYLHEGRLFVIETKAANANALSPECRLAGSRQYFWLCDSCLGKLTLHYEATSNRIAVRPKRTVAHRVSAV